LFEYLGLGKDGPSPRRAVFQASIEELYHRFYWALRSKPSPIREAEPGQATEEQRMLGVLDHFLQNYIFSFIKYFDVSSADEDEANVYMEREWRVLGDINFGLSDVHRVFMPKRYAKRFRADLPDYVGQLTFSDNI
jgi:hypothetical protein